MNGIARLWRREKARNPIPNKDFRLRQHIIFDFDGTLVDSLELHRQLFNLLAQKYGKAQLPKEALDHFRDRSLKEFLAEIGVPVYRLPALLQEGRDLLHERFSELHLFPGIKDALAAVHTQYQLHVVSSTPEPILRAVLEQERVLPYFASVHSEANVFGKDKALRSLLKKLDTSIQNAIYIGDEVRDIEACQKISLPVIAVTWGFNSAERLSAAHPDRLCTSAEEFVAFFS